MSCRFHMSCSKTLHFLTYIKHISTVKHFRNKKLMLTRIAFGSLMAPCHNIVTNCYPHKVNLLQYFYKGYIFKKTSMNRVLDLFKHCKSTFNPQLP